MAVTHNARTAKQRKLVSAFTDRFNDPDAEVEFDKLKVTVTDRETGETESFSNYQAFQRHLDEQGDEPAESASEAQEGEAETVAAEAPAEEAVETEEEEGEVEEGEGEVEPEEAVGEDDPEPEDEAEDEGEGDEAEESESAERRAAEVKANLEAKDAAAEEAEAEAAQALGEELQNLLSDMISTVERERTGELEKNEARWAKGGQVKKIDDLAARFKAMGEDSLGSRAKLLDHAQQVVDEALVDKGILEAASRMSGTELTFVKKAHEAFQEYHGDSFRLVDQIDEDGHPLVNGDGQPHTKRLGEIALSKAYHLANYATPENRDRLLSFAWRQDEATCRALGKVLADKGGAKNPDVVDDILEDFYSRRMTIERTEGGDVEVTLRGKEARDYFREQSGRVASDVRSIKVEEAFFSGGWKDTIMHASVAWKWLGLPVNDDGMMRNTVFLERLVGLVNPANHGFQGIVTMLVESGDMTEEQGQKFLAEHEAFNIGEEGPEAEKESK